jgi:esterase
VFSASAADPVPMILNTVEAGQGPIIILLHGLFGAGKNLGVLARGLSRKFRVISLDLRNHGASPHAPAMDYHTQAADVAETMAALGVGQAILIGHSMGGKVAMRLALDQPRRADALVALDIAPRRYRHDYAAQLDAMRNLPLTSGLGRHQADAAMAKTVPDPALRAFLLNNLILGEAPRWRLGLDEIAAAMADILDWDEGRAVSVYDSPALFLHGARSDYVDEAGRAVITSRFPRAGIIALPDTGHWLHAERPDAVLLAVEAFLYGAIGGEGSAA